MLIIIIALLAGSGCGLLNYNGSTTENFDASYHVQMMLAVQEEYLRIPAIINAMSTEEKVAQLFIARFPAAEHLTLAQDYQPGGFIFLDRKSVV